MIEQAMSTERADSLRHGTSNAAEPTDDFLKPGYSDRLINGDLAPLKEKNWTTYNIFAFWMSDVHSVGGYVVAGSLFALGLSSWQILVSLLIGVVIINIFSNLIARPSQQTGTPYPVTARMSFGVLGANIPAIIRGLISVAWYGINTYLASASLTVVLLKFLPALLPFADVNTHGFVGLSYLGWGSFGFLWLLQAVVFCRGMETIKKFIDFAGPAVYVVMFLLAGWMVFKAGWQNIDLTLGGVKFQGWDAVPVMITAVSLVVSFFMGPTLNFGDFARYAKSYKTIKRGNFWGLPVNFLLFSVVTVITTSSTLPVFGTLITDPVETVGRIDNVMAVLLGALTFMVSTIGINVVANFVPSAFDFSNVAPRLISWRTGGMLAATGSVFLTPWNLFANPHLIHYTLDVLGSFIGPLYGIIVVDYYLVQRRAICLDDLYTMDKDGRYWYKNGVNPKAVTAAAVAAAMCASCVVVPSLSAFENFTSIIGVFTAGALYWFLNVLGKGTTSKNQ